MFVSKTNLNAKENFLSKLVYHFKVLGFVRVIISDNNIRFVSLIEISADNC